MDSPNYGILAADFSLRFTPMKNLTTIFCVLLSAGLFSGCQRANGTSEFDKNSKVAERLVETVTTELADKVANDDVVTDSDIKILFQHARHAFVGLDNVTVRGMSIESVGKHNGFLQSDWKEFRGEPEAKSLEDAFSNFPEDFFRDGRRAIRAQITATYAMSDLEQDISEAIVILPRKVSIIERRKSHKGSAN